MSTVSFASAEGRDGADRHTGHKRERQPYKEGNAKTQAEEAAAAEEPQPGVIFEVWSLLRPQHSPKHWRDSLTLQTERTFLTMLQSSAWCNAPAR